MRCRVQAECVVAVDELTDVAREHGDEEQSCRKTEQGTVSADDDQRGAERNFDDAGEDDHHVLVDADPVGHLRLEALAVEREVGDPGDDERATEHDPRNGAEAG